MIVGSKEGHCLNVSFHMPLEIQRYVDPDTVLPVSFSFDVSNDLEISKSTEPME